MPDSGVLGGGISFPIASNSILGVFSWTTKPAANAVPFGSLILIPNVGGGQTSTGGGTWFFSNGFRWKAVGHVTLDAVDTANPSAGNTTEQNLNPNRVPASAGVIGDFDRSILRMSFMKSSNVSDATLRIYLGSTGTTADTLVATLTDLAGGNQSAGYEMEFKRTGPTTIERTGNANAASSFNGATVGLPPAAFTVPNMNTNQLAVTISSQINVGTEIVTLRDYSWKLYYTDSQ